MTKTKKTTKKKVVKKTTKWISKETAKKNNKCHWNTVYTKPKVLKELKELLKELKENQWIIYIWQLFEDRNYSRQRYSEWINKFSNDKEVKGISDTIKEILESRAITWAMKNRLNATTTIFHLKNNYGWVDKIDTENTNKNVNYNKDVWEMTDDELDDLINNS